MTLDEGSWQVVKERRQEGAGLAAGEESAARTPMSSLPLGPFAAFMQRHPNLLLFVSYCSILIVGALDYKTGNEIRVFVFYFVPIAVCSWYVGSYSGFIGAFLSAFAWTTATIWNAVEHGFTSVDAWNAGVMLTSFLSLAWLLQKLRAKQDLLLALATRDALTGLRNRRAFYHQLNLERLRSQRLNLVLSCAFFDLDGFKNLNDTKGHAVGDQALRIVGSILSTRSRRTDTSARIGGDEFVLLLPHTSLPAARGAVEELVAKMDAAFAEEGLDLSVSVGVLSVHPTQALTSDELVHAADKLMYEAKSGGKGRIVACDASDLSALELVSTR